MADPLITRQDFEARLGYTLTGALATQVDTIIEDASAVVREVAEPHLDDVEPPDVPPAVVAVMRSVVGRAFFNPNVVAGSAIDGHSWQAPGHTGVFLNIDEKKTVRSAVGKLAAGSIQLEDDLPRSSVFSYEDELGKLLGA